MIRIDCPNCGARPVEEFRYGGEPPSVPERITDPEARNIDHVWFLDNVDGPVTERWYHLAGCRRWLTLRRDTSTDTVLAPDDRAPGARHDDGGH
ncbi:MAG: sarcosine oxidase subunit delta [Acidimicrobiales bacterium]